jgi:translation initiation factor IF-3
LSKKDRVIMNDDIRVAELRCSIDGGESLGIISTDEAMSKANELGMDLVLIAPTAKPPVAKIMDYGKYKYQEEKKTQRAKKKSGKNRCKRD